MQTERAVVFLDIRDLPTAEHVLALQRRSYQVEADLIGFGGIPPLTESLEALRACEETFHGIRGGGRLIGMIAFERQGEVLDICRLAVDPNWFRQGIATQLLRFVLEANAWANEVRISTGSKNHPALNLYRGMGFVVVGETEVAPDILTTQLKKVNTGLTGGTT